MKWLLIVGGGLAAVAVLFLGVMYWWWFQPPYRLTADVAYGQRDGKPLLLDVFQPPRHHDAAVVLVVSGSWKSSSDSVQPFLVAPLLRRGYTVFAVRHISQPECLIGDIVRDMHRAVRYIRHHADRWGIDPQRLGVVGGSSGGHLSLMLATGGGQDGSPAADDVDREPSDVQCVACFYPPTDLLNLGSSTENPGDGGPPKSYRQGFGPRAVKLEDWKELGRELSPIYHITDDLPPVLIVHGDADTLVPIDQSERFVQLARAQGLEARLEVRPGKQHGWPTMLLDIPRFADWFDQHLRDRN